jgi:cyclopropane fatty-acyl-phospholipid synthase-like methyltransferase
MRHGLWLLACSRLQCPCAGLRFDAVVASEVIEHVDSVPDFCASLGALTKPGGGVVISTISRTPRSYALAIVAAEYVLGLVPRGTHQWERFITPGLFTLSHLPCLHGSWATHRAETNMTWFSRLLHWFLCMSFDKGGCVLQRSWPA